MLITENGADQSAAPSATRPRNTVTLWIYRENKARRQIVQV